MPSPTHCASVVVPVPAAIAFEFMADGMRQSHWALGSMERRDLGDGLFVGTSSWDGNELYVRLVANPELMLVDYHVGPSPDSLRFGVTSRVMDGAAIGQDADRSMITLTQWRTPDMPDEAWERESHVWPTEIQLIRSRIEHEVATGLLPSAATGAS